MGIEAFIHSLRAIVRQDKGEKINWATEVNISNTSEQTFSTVTGPGVLKFIYIKGTCVATAYVLNELKTTVDGGTEVVFTTASGSTAGVGLAPKAGVSGSTDVYSHRIDFNTRFKTSLIVKVTATGSTGNLYVGFCYTTDI